MRHEFHESTQIEGMHECRSYKVRGNSCNSCLILVVQVVVALSAALPVAARAAGASFKFGDVAFSPGSTVEANVPLSAQEKSLAAQSSNAVPSNAVAVLATPAN